MTRYWSATWLGAVPTAKALDLGDPFPAPTWYAARAHACAMLGLSIEAVRVEEVDETHVPRDVEEVVEDEEQASGVRLRLVTEDEDEAELDPAGVGEEGAG